MKAYPRAAPLALGLFLAWPPFAGAERLPVRAYGTAEGLPSDLVQRITADSHGFLWFATRDGLARFDGARFVTYGLEQGLPVPAVSHLIEGRQGDYWVATNGGGVCRLSAQAAFTDPRTGKPASLCRLYPLPGEYASRVNVLHEDQAGNIWAGTDAGLFVLEDHEGAFRSAAVRPPEAAPARFAVHALVEDGEGSLWIGGDGLFRRLPGGHVIEYALEGSGTEGIHDLMRDRHGRIWVPRARGLLVFQPEPASAAGGAHLSRRLARVPERPSGEDRMRLPSAPGEATWRRLGLTWTYGPFESSDGRVWIGSQQGLLEFDGGRFRRYTKAHGLAHDNVAVRAEDRDGNLWLRSQGSGAMKLSRGGFTTYDERDGLAHPSVHSLQEDASGRLLVMGREWSLSRFDGSGFTSARPLPPGPTPAWLSQMAFVDRSGGWWLLSQEGLGRLPAVRRLEDLRGRRPDAVYTTRDGLLADNVYHVFEDGRGDLWLSVRSPAATGVMRWERATGRFHRYGVAEGWPEGRSPSAYCEDPQGTLWLGLYEQGGLVRFRGGRFTVVEGVPEGSVTALHLDGAGRLWLGTSHGGLARIDEPAASPPRLRRYTTADGLGSNNVRALTSDGYGRLYAGTVRGVDRLDPATGLVKRYTTRDGLASGFVTTALRDREGTLWFGTFGGLSRLRPVPDRPRPPPPVRIGGLRIAGVAHPVAHLGQPAVDGLRLGAQGNPLQIDFFGVGFATGESLRYQYMLEGADADWSVPSDERTVHYSRLAPGRYRFQVRAVSADGPAAGLPAHVAFTIPPPIWARGWFLAAAALGIALLAYLAYRIRVARLLALERVRMRIATDLHDDIGASLSHIAILSELARRRSADPDGTAGPLERIAESSRELVDSMSDIVWAINPHRDSLGDLLHRMRRFASDTFTARDIAFRFQAPPDDGGRALGADVRRQLLLIFKEGVNNLVRHSGCTRAEVEVRLAPDRLILRLSDDGRGFEPAAAADGHGLPSMSSRARELGGELEIASAPGRGTTLTLTLPLRQRRRPPRSLPA